MEALQSSPLCAHIGLVLLLTGLICSLPPEVQGKPIDYWCNDKVRSHMLEQVKKLEQMASCRNSTLSIQVPNVGLQEREWKNKTVQQQSAEVMKDLNDFLHGVQGAKNENVSACQSFLEQLEKCINQYKGVVHYVQKQVGASQGALDRNKIFKTINEVQRVFENLLFGKMARLRDSFKTMCNHNSSGS